MAQLLQDLKFGARTLTKQPGLAAIAVVAFALGIGLTTTMYSIVHGALQDLPYPESHRLMHLERSHLSRGIESMEVSLHDFRDWRAQQESFTDLAAFYMGTANLSGSEGRPERFSAAFMTENSFDLLGVQPILGRDFRSGEDAPDAPRVTILGHHVWKNRYGADPAILGQPVRINGAEWTVVGVMPEGFRFPFLQDLWLPLRLDPDSVERGEGRTLEVFGRLADGVSLDRARAEIAGIARRLEIEYPESNEGIGSLIKPYTLEFVGEEAARLLYVMLGAVFGVLLIACANVANLLLARTALRSREVAVRSALGASRLRVIVQLLSETLVLAAAGALLGLALAAVGLQAFDRAVTSTDPPYWLTFGLDLKVLAFAVGITLLASLLSGLVPALKASGERVNEVLKDAGRGSSGLYLGRFSKGLVVAEIALSCGLLVAAGLMTRSIVELRTVEHPIATEDVFTARVGLFESDYPEAEDRELFFRELQERLGELPGVRETALTTSLPGVGTGWRDFELEGETYPDPDERPVAHRAVITPGFFTAFGAEVLEGRSFRDDDRRGELPVAVVNRSFVEKHFAGESPLGKRIDLDPDDAEEPWRTIVGVVPDLYMDSLGNTLDPEPAGVYVPLAQSDVQFVSIVARAQGDPTALTGPVRSAVTAIDADLPIYFVNTMDAVLAQETWFVNVFGTLFLVFGLSALILAAVGLYGVMAFSVSRRTHEVGIRMALGARARQVLRLVLRQGLLQLGLGLVLGMLLALPLALALRILLFGVDPLDPTTFLLIVAVLLAAGLTACLVPARRAARVEPAVALRRD